MSESHPSRAEAKAIGDSLASFADRPAILLWGERDWCFTPTMRETFQHHLPAAEVHRFENAGHYVMEDAANEIVAAMEGFLAKHPLS